MKKLFFFSTLFLSMSNVYKSNACGCSETTSFCNSYNSYDIAVSFLVTDTFTNGISLKVLNLLFGEETKDTITVWDLGGPYNLCNDSSTVSLAKFIGNIGDTLILSLPKIDTLKNSWDVIGDYITPGFSCNEYRLRVYNNTIHGRVSGDQFCHYMDDCIDSYGYNKFITEFTTKSINCSFRTGTETLRREAPFSFFPNPTKSKIAILTKLEGKLLITNHAGQIIDQIEITMDSNSSEVNIESYPTGIYFLRFENEDLKITEKLLVD